VKNQRGVRGQHRNRNRNRNRNRVMSKPDPKSAVALWRRVYRYLRHDVKEIVSPSPMPNPEWYKTPVKKTARERIQIVRAGFSDYLAGWRPKAESDEKHEAGEEAVPSKDSDGEQHLAEMAGSLGRKTAEGARPYLQRIYKTRMGSYRDALKEFSNGFKEGLQSGKDGEEQQREPTQGKSSSQ